MWVTRVYAHEHTPQHNEEEKREWAIGLHFEIILHANKTDRAIIFDETNAHTHTEWFVRREKELMCVYAYRK